MGVEHKEPNSGDPNLLLQYHHGNPADDHWRTEPETRSSTRARPSRHVRDTTSGDRDNAWEPRGEHRRERISDECSERGENRERTSRTIYRSDGRNRDRSRSGSTPRSRHFSRRDSGEIRLCGEVNYSQASEEMIVKARYPRFEIEDSGCRNDWEHDSMYGGPGNKEEVVYQRHVAENRYNELPLYNHEVGHVPSYRPLDASNQQEKNDTAAVILSCVCLDFEGKIILKTLRKALFKRCIILFKSSKELHGFLKEYPRVFSFDIDGKIDESSLEVTATPSVKLCLAHSTKAGSCPGNCESFHICKYFFLSTCDVPLSGKRCYFGHEMATEHNRKVLREALLHKFPPGEEGVLLKLEYRNSTTIPVICRFYNNLIGCRNTSCRFLHICSRFVMGNCRAVPPSTCRLSHDAMADQPFKILRRYGIGPMNEDMEHAVLNLLERGYGEQKSLITSITARASVRTENAPAWISTSNSESASDDVDEDLSDGQCQWTQETSPGTWVVLEHSEVLERAYVQYTKARRKYSKAKRPNLLIGNQLITAHFAQRRMEVGGGARCRIRRVKRESREADE